MREKRWPRGGAGCVSAVGSHPAVRLFEPGHGVGVVGRQLGGVDVGDRDDVGVVLSPYPAGRFGGGGCIAQHPAGGEEFRCSGSVFEVEPLLDAEGCDGVGVWGLQVHGSVER